MSVSIPMSSGAVAAGVAAAADPAPLGAVATGIDHIFIAGAALGVVAPTPARCAPQPSGPVPGAGCPPPLTTSLNLKGTP